MKRVFKSLFTLSLAIILSGCVFVTTDSTTLQETTTVTEPTDAMAIATEFTHLESLLPVALSEDTTLPDVANPAISLQYRLDGILVVDRILVYDFPANDTERILSVRLTIDDQSSDRDYVILFHLDAAAHAQYLIDFPYLAAYAVIDEAIPAEIGSDLTLPELEQPGTTVVYEVSTSRIYNGRFIFPFPVADTTVTVTATVTHASVAREYSFPVVMKGLASLSKIPDVYIVTEGNADVVSREDYIDATLSLVTYDENLIPTTVMDDVVIEIRGRGNSTWFMPKQPFRIKFGSKTAFFADYAEKTWVLLANFTDQTLMRNYLAYNFARDIGMAFAPSASFANLYLNGEFLGNYMISDQIEVTSNRVDIAKDSTDTDTGYLLEMDKRLLDIPEGVLGVDYFLIYGVPYAIKSPKTDGEFYTVAQFNYIESYIATVHLALRNHQDYTPYIDIDSFVDWFIVEEVFQNVDAGYSSCYMYKDIGEKLKMGPIWDFDLSSGNAGHMEAYLQQPTGWYTPLEVKNIWFYYLMSYGSFQDALKARWNELYEDFTLELLAKIYPTADAIARSRYENFQTWDVIGSNDEWYTADAVLALTTYEEQVEYLYDYLAVRIAWLNDAINDL